MPVTAYHIYCKKRIEDKSDFPVLSRNEMKHVELLLMKISIQGNTN